MVRRRTNRGPTGRAPPRTSTAACRLCAMMSRYWSVAMKRSPAMFSDAAEEHARDQLTKHGCLAEPAGEMSARQCGGDDDRQSERQPSECLRRAAARVATTEVPWRGAPCRRVPRTRWTAVCLVMRRHPLFGQPELDQSKSIGPPAHQGEAGRPTLVPYLIYRVYAVWWGYVVWAATR